MRTALSAAVVLGCVASAASANFNFSHSRTTFSIDENGTPTNYDRVTFYVQNDGLNLTAGSHNLQTLELNVNSTAPMRFTYADQDGDGRLDVAITTSSAIIGQETALTTRMLNEIFNPTMLSISAGPGRTNPDPETLSSSTYNAVRHYTSLQSFYAIGGALGAALSVPAGTGRGAGFLTVVTAPGATVNIFGKIGAEIGTGTPIGAFSSAALTTAPGITPMNATSDLQPFAYVALAPEPATLCTAALAGMIAVHRRRR